MVDRRRSPDNWKTVGLWLTLLSVIGVAHSFASLSRGTSFWEAIPWKTLAFGAVFFGFASWLSSRPLSPEAEEGLRRYVEERSTCKRCGAPRTLNDVFCSVCHRKWERAIAVVLILGMAWAAYLLLTIHPRR